MEKTEHGRSPLTALMQARRLLLPALLYAASLLNPERASGIGSRIPNQDAAAIARGNAFVATADNPSALYYNPAGITQLEGHHAQLGLLTYLNIYTDYESPAGAKTENQPDIIPVPQFYYTFSPKNSPFSFGFGTYAPFGLGMEWPDNAPFATAGLEARLSYITLNPAVAWQPLPSLSLGIGPNFNISEAKLRQATGPSSSFVFRGDDIGYGFNAGARWQPHSQWAFGASYRSGSTLDYEGTGHFRPPDITIDSAAEFKFPQIIAGGISYRPTTNWNLEINVDWTDWNTLNTVNFENVGSVPFNWVSSWTYEVGVTRNLGHGYYVSAGYYFTETSTPDKNYTPIVPDIDLHVGSLGFGRKGVRWDWAIAGQFIGGFYRTVTGNVNPTVNGRYRLVTPTVSASIGYHF